MNVLNDNWLYVRYLDNEIKQISVRQAFLDAEKIKSIESPTYHNTKVLIYDVPVIQLLSTILLAAYFKPETNFVARKNFSEELLKKDWDINIILNYLNTWQDKFNLEDKQYPFLQDIKLKNFTKKDDTFEFLCKTNLVTPGGNNLIFEHNPNRKKTELSQYMPTLDELIYMLLYINSISTSPMAKVYPNKALCAKQTMFMIAFGKNLKETIIYNCLSLNSNDHEKDFYDKPIWELDSLDEIQAYIETGNLYKNTLLCTFFPCQPVYVLLKNNIPANIQLDKNFISFMTKEEKEQLASQYVISNPWMIAKQSKEGNTYDYKEWNNSIKLINLCIEITKQISEHSLCNMLEKLPKHSHVNCVIYYREYDGMKSNVLSFGKYEISQDIFDKLQTEQNHAIAEQFQEGLAKIQSTFNILKKTENNSINLSEFVLNDLKLTFSKHAEYIFFNSFVPCIEEPNNLKDTLTNLIQYAKRIVKESAELSQNPLQYAKTYAIFCGKLNKIRKEYENGRPNI